MVPKSEAHPLSDMADYIRSAHKRVEATTGVAFGKVFIEKTLDDHTIISESETPSKYFLALVKHHPDKAITIAHQLQKILYWDGKRFDSANSYTELSQYYHFKPEQIWTEAVSKETEAEMQSNFEFSRQQGITGFPSVLIKKNDKIYQIVSGFENSSEIIKKIDNLLK
jgi:putative protein-disulfide isomerase